MKMRAMKEAAEHLHGKLQVELPLEDLEPLVDGKPSLFLVDRDGLDADGGDSRDGGQYGSRGSRLVVGSPSPPRVFGRYRFVLVHSVPTLVSRTSAPS